MVYYTNVIPPEILLSSWVFYWAMLYFVIRELLPSMNLSWCDPTFAILFTLSYQFYALINILFRVNPFSKLIRVLVKFSILTTLFKLIPLYIVWIHKVNWVNSILSFAIVFLIYLVYIDKLNLTLLDIYNDLTESYIYDDNRIQFYRFLHNAKIIS